MGALVDLAELRFERDAQSVGRIERTRPSYTFAVAKLEARTKPTLCPSARLEHRSDWIEVCGYLTDTRQVSLRNEVT